MKSRRGSVAIAALIFGALCALGLTFLLRSAVNDTQLAARSFYFNAAMNLAEAGIEDAMWAANSGLFDSTHGWSIAGTAASKTITSGLDFGANTTGRITIRVDDYAGATPLVTAAGTVALPHAAGLTKQIRVRLDRRSAFANGVVSREWVNFNGNNIAIDSYDSDNGPWTSGTRRDHGSVATVATNDGSLGVNNADIWGTIATGGGDPNIGPNGSVRGSDTATGTDVDPGRVRRDFSANLPEVSYTPPYAPIDLTTINAALTLPRAGDVLPTGQTRYVYRVPAISLTNAVLTLDGPVDLIVDYNVSVGGTSGAINVTATGAVAMYVGGDLSINGHGMVNATERPASLQVYGRRTAAETASLGNQVFFLSGNAAMQAAVYAPHATIELKGGGTSGSFSGAIVGATIKFTGNYAFHYDERLGDLDCGNLYRVASWMELTESASSTLADFRRDNTAPFAGLPGI